jgi:hypothetical protein
MNLDPTSQRSEWRHLQIEAWRALKFGDLAASTGYVATHLLRIQVAESKSLMPFLENVRTLS